MRFLLLMLACLPAIGSEIISGNVTISGDASATVTLIDPIEVDAFQDFNDFADEEALTEAGIESSKRGLGTWSKHEEGEFATFTVVERAAYSFRTRVSVDGEILTSTGTKWLRYDYSTNTVVENMNLTLPGGSGGAFRFACIRMFIRFGQTNISGALRNIDHVLTYGNPFGVLQLQISGSGNNRAFIAHASLNDGSTRNSSSGLEMGADGYITIEPGGAPCYYVVMVRDGEDGRWTISFYNPLTWELVKTISTTMGTNNNVWLIQFAANYLSLGGLTGFVEMGGISVTWTNEDVRP